ncbi:FAD-dependent oxidoreductase [Streptomyces poonensis]|uniref:FAD-binding monooxygenase n=1 Tax=Streptomyces poonensis TaxID=68255 RepID=A0A918PEF7_9ACTN|nr:FAD-dependent monooxygenase [Streptomyces poonensis]GGZ01057.1 FAD-binding monooxygenase [Streptomyces poonensis]GLJ90384.1 FAD-binding monooxygenase [Streptomyces poonensis]
MDFERRAGGRDHGRPGGRHAVVVGGSIAGLLAAHVLAGQADRVTVVERDRLPEGPGPRPGVPQGRHPHVLLEGGQRALDALLPGFTDELRAAGAPRVGMPGDMVQWQAGRWFRRSPSSTYIHTGSRAQIEDLVRRRVLAHPAITVVESTDVVGLLGDASRVRGVLLRERGEGTRAAARPLEADLVVDASGRGTKASQWLTAIGAEAPHEETIDTGLAYASRVYRAVTGTLGGDALGYNIVPGPAQPYGCVVLPLEDGTYLLTFSGLRGDEPPTDEEEFVAYAKRLPHPFVHRWMREAAEPLSPVSGFRRTADVRRRYDLPGRRPAGFLATGDALCTFNPIYGQGMTVAAQSAVALRDALADGRRPPTTRRVQQALLAASRQAWDISAGADKQMPGAVGNAVATRAVDRATAWYLRRVQERVSGNPVVGAAFRSVVSLVSPATVLFAPRVARAVLFGPPAPAPAGPPLTRDARGA